MKKDYQLFRRTTPTWARLLVASSLAIALMLIDGQNNRLNIVREAAQTITSPIKNVYTSVYQWGNDLFHRAYSVQQLTLDNQKLTTDHAEKTARLVQLSQVESDNQALKKLLDLKNTQPDPSIATQVLYQVVNPYERKLVLDKGSNDGVAAGQPVISSDGLLGLVTSVTASTSVLTLVLDTKINVPVQIERTPEARGFLSGKQEEGFLEVRFFRTQEALGVNDVLVTSGLDGLYPKGLPVARVTNIGAVDKDGQSEITVVPTTQGMSARYVLILQIKDSLQAQTYNNEKAEAVLKDNLPTTLGGRKRQQVQAEKEEKNAN